jgi:hypothetical protein
MGEELHSELLARLRKLATDDLVTPGEWIAYFNPHGDPYLVPADRPFPTSAIANVNPEPRDYGRANALYLGAVSPPVVLALIDKMESMAKTLRKISADVRGAGDMGLVILDDDGVAPAPISLADELWLYALLLDGKLRDDE